MGNVKYSDETVKYRIRAKITIDGVVAQSDIFGALFSMTEGLLDQEMELKHLQRTGRIGRIDLNISNKKGKTVGTIEVPSSLNKIETAILAATLESVDRVGACSCKIELEKIVDVRKDKRSRIAKRAAEIMKKWDLDTQSQNVDISAVVEQDAKRGRIIKFGSDKLPAGPGIYDSDEIILVEGRADINNLLKMGIENTIALQGTNVPNTIKNLCRKRTVTALLDGDGGGDMILKELLLSTDIEYVARAPYKREVEHLSINEIREILDNKVPVTKAKFIIDKKSVYDFLKKNKRYNYLDRAKNGKSGKNGKSKNAHHSRKSHKSSRHTERRSERHSDRRSERSPDRSRRDSRRTPRRQRDSSRPHKPRVQVPKPILSIVKETKKTMNAVFVNQSMEKLLTVSTSDVYDRLNGLEGISAIVVDGVITQRLLDLADKKSIKLVAGAVLGQIEKEPKITQYITFNRL